MAKLSDQARGVSYPMLTRAQINALIASLLETRGQLEDVAVAAEADSALGYLVNYHTRRWGLPPAILGPAGGQQAVRRA
jgi:hypothetical protein